MKRNIGNTDRLVRITAGLAIVGWGIANQSWLGLIGLIPLFTALFRWCPAYVPLGMSTCGRE